MNGLLKADFRRVIKDKLLIVMGILAVVFALFTPLLCAVIVSGIGTQTDEMVADMISGLFTAKGQFFGSFSMGNNLGLIAPVLLAIVLCKDFSYGTVRNKIIAGKSRSQIYLSLFVTCSVVLIGVMLLHAFVTLGVGLIFFDYQTEVFTAGDFWYFLVSLGFEILVLLFVSSLLSWLCASMKNVGLVIVLYVAVAFILVLAGNLTQTLMTVMEMLEQGENYVSVLGFVSKINVFNSATYIGAGSEYSLKDVLYLTVPALCGIFGFTALGVVKFNRKDLK